VTEELAAAEERLLELLGEAKQLAREYYELTAKPLGITGEVAEYEAARLLGVELAPARTAGYDAVRKTRNASSASRSRAAASCRAPSRGSAWVGST
jgi:hypothetical protein